MNWFRSLLSTRAPGVALPAAYAQRLAALRGLPPHDSRTPLRTQRWMVVDVETGGLDAEKDALLSIGAIIIEGGRIQLGCAFESHLQQTSATSHENILIHGLTHSRQLSGTLALDALLDFAEFAGSTPLVAFHAAFDRTALQTAMKQKTGWQLANHWLDAAVIAPLLFPDMAKRCRHLDDWLTAFKLENFGRHSALADAVATAQLWQILLEAATRQQIATTHQLQNLLLARKWLG